MPQEPGGMACQEADKRDSEEVNAGGRQQTGDGEVHEPINPMKA